MPPHNPKNDIVPYCSNNVGLTSHLMNDWKRRYEHKSKQEDIRGETSHPILEFLQNQESMH